VGSKWPRGRHKKKVKKVEYINWQRTRQRSKKSRPPKKEILNKRKKNKPFYLLCVKIFSSRNQTLNCVNSRWRQTTRINIVIASKLILKWNHFLNKFDNELAKRDRERKNYRNTISIKQLIKKGLVEQCRR